VDCSLKTKRLENLQNPSFISLGELLSYDQPGHWCAECGEVFLEKSDREANAFSRYENGRSYPTKGVENFLRILDKHPEHIDELREAA
jgi:hypothetical protein